MRIYHYKKILPIGINHQLHGEILHINIHFQKIHDLKIISFNILILYNHSYLQLEVQNHAHLERVKKNQSQKLYLEMPKKNLLLIDIKLIILINKQGLNLKEKHLG